MQALSRQMTDGKYKGSPTGGFAATNPGVSLCETRTGETKVVLCRYVPWSFVVTVPAKEEKTTVDGMTERNGGNRDRN